MINLAGRISQDIVAEVKRSADIVEIISRYISLKRAGRNFKALCPFHTEKTPSFIVNPERQFFHCFGCGKGGDVFTFVAEHERVEFPEAVRIVAAAVGITIPEGWGSGGGAAQQLKTRLYQLHRWAAHFFAKQLAHPNGKRARDYLLGRGFSPESLEAWGIGYAPDAWDTLGKAARAAGFSDKELLASGLVIQRDSGGHYDRFRNRIMFPIRDTQGRVIAFGGRTLGDDTAKYINSPETPLFSKSRCLFGLDKARDAIVAGRRVLITEGYTDTIMCHQMGITWAVATLGTALTRDHASLLRRYADTVLLLFDADRAGEAAVDRSLEVFANSDLVVRVPSIEKGSDPCDFLLAHGAEAFLERLDGAAELYDVKLEMAASRHDLASADGRAKAVDECLEALAAMANVAKADLLTEKVAKRFGLDRGAVRARLATLRKKARRNRSTGSSQTTIELDPIEHGILRAILAANELVPSVLAQAGPEDFQDTRARRIFQACVELYDREGEIDIAELSATLQDSELAGIVARIALSIEGGGNWEEWLQDCLARLAERKRREELRRLRASIRSPQGFDREALAAILEHHRQRAARASDQDRH